MPASSTYLVLSLIILIIVAGLLFVIPRQQKRMTPLASMAFVCILAGITLGQYRWVGYVLLGIGLVLAVIDILRKAKNQGTDQP